MKTLLIVGILILPAVLPAITFTDDFDSYTPGDDLEDSPYWYRLDPCGNLTVTDQGGNMTVETAWNGYKYLTYNCLGSGVVTDCVIEADMKYTGMETSCGLLARIDDSTGECYVGYIYSAYPVIGVTFIAYIDENGNYTTLVSDYYYPFNPDSWYTVSFQVTGSNPAEMSISVNGTVNSTFQDTTYNIGAGSVGLVSKCTSTASVFSIDNFSVVDSTSNLNAVTFGGIKALFR